MQIWHRLEGWFASYVDRANACLEHLCIRWKQGLWSHLCLNRMLINISDWCERPLNWTSLLPPSASSVNEGLPWEPAVPGKSVWADVLLGARAGGNKQARNDFDYQGRETFLRQWTVFSFWQRGYSCFLTPLGSRIPCFASLLLLSCFPESSPHYTEGSQSGS